MSKESPYTEKLPIISKQEKISREKPNKNISQLKQEKY